MIVRNRWLWGLCFIVLAVVSIRYAWISVRSGLTWRDHVEGWKVTACLVFGLECQPLGERAPEEQAKYWLKQVPRVAAAASNSQIALGAAWMLDSPQNYFQRHHVQKLAATSIPGPPLWIRDTATIESLTEEFEGLCRSNCLRQVRIAVDLDPSNVDVWRAYALLLFQSKSAGLELQPRQENWLEVLDECTRHDPGNALYDYLACLCLWNKSATYNWNKSGYKLTVNEPKEFQAGGARFKQGLAKPHLKFGSRDYVATQAFLLYASASTEEQFRALRSREIQNRATGLLFQIQRWQSVRLDVAQGERDFKRVKKVALDTIFISDQLTRSENSSDTPINRLHLRRWAKAVLKKLGNTQSHVMTPLEIKQVQHELDETRRESELLSIAINNLFPSDKQKRSGSKILIDTIFLILTVQVLGFVALGMAVVMVPFTCWIVRGEPNDPVVLGSIQHVLAWAGGIGLSYVLFGIHAAGLTSKPEESETLLKTFSRWELIWLQWQGNRGPLIAVSLAVMILTCWALIRRAYRVPGGVREISRFHLSSEIGSIGRLVMQSCLIATLVFLTSYLFLLLLVPQQQNRSYAVRSMPLIDPAGTLQELDKELARLELDETKMEKIRAQIAELNRSDEAAD